MTQTYHFVFISSEDDNHLVKGGIGTYLGIVTRHIANQGFDVTWITETLGEDFEIIDDHGCYRCYLNRKGKEVTLFAQRIQNKLNEVIQNRPNSRLIIEAPDWEGLASDFFQKYDEKNILKVSRLHTPLAVCAPLNNLPLNIENCKQMLREEAQLLASDILSAPTNYVLNETFDKIPSVKKAYINSFVIPNPINLNFGQAQQIMDDNDFVILPSGFNICILGSVEKRKGVDLIMRAAPEIIRNIPHTHFWFIGHHHTERLGNLTANSKLKPKDLLAELPKRLKKNIHFTGYVNHKALPKLLAQMDLSLFAYKGDNFPGALAEVILSNIPTITLMAGGVPEMIETHGVQIKLGEDEYIVQQFIRAIKAQYKKDALQIKKEASLLKSHMVEKFSPIEVSKQISQTYIDQLENKCQVL